MESKGLKALKEIKDNVVAEYIDDYKGHFETIEKELKALEILRKHIDITFFYTEYEYTQEENDLLKEVLL